MEKELRKAFEETTTRNVNAILAHSNQTRKMLRESEKKIESLNDLIELQNETINLLRTQLVSIQSAFYRSGT